MNGKQKTLFQAWNKKGFANTEHEHQNEQPSTSRNFGDEHDFQARRSIVANNPGTAPGFDSDAGKTWIYPTNYPIRDYQYNMVREALFKNTMVVLPTGLGKTFIAAVVMYNIYRWYPDGKVVFMAPTRPLVAQQQEACLKVTEIPEAETCIMTGTVMPERRAHSWIEKRVFFLTPQTLANDLARSICPAVSVKCVVIDEAHKALGNHAYCEVIQQLQIYTSEFRVLALTATPGSDTQAVKQVISNLLIEHIELRTEDSDDVKSYSHARNIDKIVVPLGEELSSLRDKFLDIINVYLKRLTMRKAMSPKNPSTLSRFQILKLRDCFRDKCQANFDSKTFGLCMADFSLCISLYHAYELLLMHGVRPFHNFLTGILEGEKSIPHAKSELLKSSDFEELMQLISEKFMLKNPILALSFGNSCLNSNQPVQSQALVPGHPKLKRLEEILLDHFQKFTGAEGSGTRVIIFSQYRDSVKEIEDTLKRHDPFVRAMSFVGQSSKSGSSITQKQQLQVVKKFREGGFNTLVATCVAEEGLDIGEVDLIICYDCQKSPIRLVQRMGRTGRLRDGRIVMLLAEGKEEQLYKNSECQKKSIFKAVKGGLSFADFYQDSPRLVPPGIYPTCVKKRMEIQPKSNQITKSTNASNSSGFLDEQEKLYFKQHFEFPENDTPVLKTHGNFISIPKSYNNKGADVADDRSNKPLLCVDKWRPWQTTPQKAFKVSHSPRTMAFVEMMYFLNFPQTLPDYSSKTSPRKFLKPKVPAVSNPKKRKKNNIINCLESTSEKINDRQIKKQANSSPTKTGAISKEDELCPVDVWEMDTEDSVGIMDLVTDSDSKKISDEEKKLCPVNKEVIVSESLSFILSKEIKEHLFANIKPHVKSPPSLTELTSFDFNSILTCDMDFSTSKSHLGTKLLNMSSRLQIVKKPTSEIIRLKYGLKGLISLPENFSISYLDKLPTLADSGEHFHQKDSLKCESSNVQQEKDFDMELEKMEFEIDSFCEDVGFEIAEQENNNIVHTDMNKNQADAANTEQYEKSSKSAEIDTVSSMEFEKQKIKSNIFNSNFEVSNDIIKVNSGNSQRLHNAFDENRSEICETSGVQKKGGQNLQTKSVFSMFEDIEVSKPQMLDNCDTPTSKYLEKLSISYDLFEDIESPGRKLLPPSKKPDLTNDEDNISILKTTKSQKQLYTRDDSVMSVNPKASSAKISETISKSNSAILFSKRQTTILKTTPSDGVDFERDKNRKGSESNLTLSRDQNDITEIPLENIVKSTVSETRNSYNQSKIFSVLKKRTSAVEKSFDPLFMHKDSSIAAAMNSKSNISNVLSTNSLLNPKAETALHKTSDSLLAGGSKDSHKSMIQEIDELCNSSLPLIDDDDCVLLCVLDDASQKKQSKKEIGLETNHQDPSFSKTSFTSMKPKATAKTDEMKKSTESLSSTEKVAQKSHAIDDIFDFSFASDWKSVPKPMESQSGKSWLRRKSSEAIRKAVPGSVKQTSDSSSAFDDNSLQKPSTSKMSSSAAPSSRMHHLKNHDHIEMKSYSSTNIKEDVLLSSSLRQVDRTETQNTVSANNKSGPYSKLQKSSKNEQTKADPSASFPSVHGFTSIGGKRPIFQSDNKRTCAASDANASTLYTATQLASLVDCSIRPSLEDHLTVIKDAQPEKHCTDLCDEPVFLNNSNNRESQIRVSQNISSTPVNDGKLSSRDFQNFQGASDEILAWDIDDDPEFVKDLETQTSSTPVGPCKSADLPRSVFTDTSLMPASESKPSTKTKNSVDDINELELDVSFDITFSQNENSPKPVLKHTKFSEFGKNCFKSKMNKDCLVAKKRTCTSARNIDGNDTDDDFKIPVKRSRLSKTLKKNSSKKPLHASSTSSEVVKSKKRSTVTAKEFLVQEAEVSDSDASADEVEGSQMDRLESSFIDDNFHLNEERTDMQAHYLQSVKNYVGQPKRYKFKFSPCRKDVFSQVVMDQSADYIQDSFCVGDDEIIYLSSEEESVTMMIKKKKHKKRKRIAVSDSSDSENEFQSSHPGRQQEGPKNDLPPRSMNHVQVHNSLEQGSLSKKPIFLESPTLSNPVASTSKVDHRNNEYFAKVCVATKKKNILSPIESKWNSHSITSRSPKSFNVKQITTIDKKNTRGNMDNDVDFDDDPSLAFSFDIDWDDIKEPTQTSSPKEFCSHRNKLEPEPKSSLSKTASGSHSADSQSRMFHSSKLKSMNDVTSVPQSNLKFQSNIGSKLSQSSSYLSPSMQYKIPQETTTANRNPANCVPHDNASTSVASSSFFTCRQSPCFDDNVDATSQSGNSSVLMILISSRELARGKSVMNELKHLQSVKTFVMTLPDTDYIVSNRLAVARIIITEFMIHNSMAKTFQKVKAMKELYEKCCIIVEKESRRSSNGYHKDITRHLEFALVIWCNSSIKILYSESPSETAKLLFGLADGEKKRGLHINVPVRLESKKQQMFQFYSTLPQVSPVCALYYVENFHTVGQFLKSNPKELSKNGCISQARAAVIHRNLNSNLKL